VTYAEHMARAGAAQASVYAPTGGVPGGGDPCTMHIGGGDWVTFPHDPSELGD
jgi:hypothetical protein